MSSILLAGATGLTGSHVLSLLADHPSFERVVVIARRPPDRPVTAGNVEWHVVDFDRLREHAGLLRVDQVICTFGTTIAAAGSRERFRHVDHEIPLSIATLALEGGARHFLLVSALGADAGSRIFYNRVKGELEDALRSLRFRSVSVLRPSLLTGNRRELRIGERIAQLLGGLVPGRYRPVPASRVAEVLVKLAVEDAPGWRIVESEEIRTGSARPDIE
jgi:uncharacterized protein YbjT (DUF2867 family)